MKRSFIDFIVDFVTGDQKQYMEEKVKQDMAVLKQKMEEEFQEEMAALRQKLEEKLEEEIAVLKPKVSTTIGLLCIIQLCIVIYICYEVRVQRNQERKSVPTIRPFKQIQPRDSMCAICLVLG